VTTKYFNKNYITLLTFPFWMVVALIVFIQATIAMKINGDLYDWFSTFILSCGWILWSLLTPVIVWTVGKIENRKVNLYGQILLYFVLSVFFVFLHISLEMTLYNIAFVKSGISVKLPDYVIYHIHTQFLAFFFIVFVTKGIRFFFSFNEARLQEEKLNAELSNARLQALKMQLNPHFLFNTHHSIISLMTKGENTKATEMLMKLSDFLRITLNSSHQLSTLADEIRLMKFYLDIQQIRFGEKLAITIDAGDDVLNAAVPSFILQPLIENAIVHGIAPYSQAATLSVSCTIINGVLEIEVSDNGGGLRTDQFMEGVGLKNTKERLQELYKDKGVLSVKPHPVKGTLCKVCLPFTIYNEVKNE
jgi:two-component system, LytTR family, sensor kinase